VPRSPTRWRPRSPEDAAGGARMEFCSSGKKKIDSTVSRYPGAQGVAEPLVSVPPFPGFPLPHHGPTTG